MQFDVYRTPGRARDTFPYLVDIQSELANEFKTRYVVPLLPVRTNVLIVQRANPTIEFEGHLYLFVANQLANIDGQRLIHVVGNLSHYRDEMIASIDFMLVGI